MVFKTSREYTDALYNLASSYEGSPHLIDEQAPEVKDAILNLQVMIEKKAEHPKMCDMCYSAHWADTPCSDIINLFLARAKEEYIRKKQKFHISNQPGG